MCHVPFLSTGLQHRQGGGWNFKEDGGEAQGLAFANLMCIVDIRSCQQAAPG
jgi:hypothetical protein